jgi:hypothetical protein
MSTIIRLFLDTHMGLSHPGLIEIAKNAKVNVDKLNDGDLLMFINRKLNKVKVLGAKGKVIGYLRTPDNRPIMLDALQYLPHTFGGASWDYTEACKLALQKKLNLNQ